MFRNAFEPTCTSSMDFWIKHHTQLKGVVGNCTLKETETHALRYNPIVGCLRPS